MNFHGKLVAEESFGIYIQLVLEVKFDLITEMGSNFFCRANSWD